MISPLPKLSSTEDKISFDVSASLASCETSSEMLSDTKSIDASPTVLSLPETVIFASSAALMADIDMRSSNKTNKILIFLNMINSTH